MVSVSALARTARAYAASSVRIARRGGLRPLGREERLVFVVGSPRSGTTFTGRALGSQPGFVDLDEVTPLKAALPILAASSPEEAGLQLRRIIERVRTLGLVRGLRGVEQTPETSFLVRAALDAYPQAIAVHVIRDGRDVVCSLLERGWLRSDRQGGDDARQAYGAHARFWVEPERRDEFASASEAARAAWAWRRHVTAALTTASRNPERTLELRYEELTTDPGAAAERLARHLGLDRQLLVASLAAARDRSVGRWRRDLTPEQLEDVEREAGPLLRELGYEGASPA